MLSGLTKGRGGMQTQEKARAAVCSGLSSVLFLFIILIFFLLCHDKKPLNLIKLFYLNGDLT